MAKKHSAETRAKISSSVKKAIESRSTNDRIGSLASNFSAGRGTEQPTTVRNYGGLKREVTRSVPQPRPEAVTQLTREQVADLVAGETNVKRVPSIAALREGEHGGKIRPPELPMTQRPLGSEIRSADTSNKIMEKS